VRIRVRPIPLRPALTLGLVFGLLLLPALASGTGSTPIVAPTIYTNGLIHLAQQRVPTRGTAYYTEMVKFQQTFTLRLNATTPYCTSGPHALPCYNVRSPSWFNITTPSVANGLPDGSQLYSEQYWLNLTSGTMVCYVSPFLHTECASATTYLQDYGSWATLATSFRSYSSGSVSSLSLMLRLVNVTDGAVTLYPVASLSTDPTFLYTAIAVMTVPAAMTWTTSSQYSLGSFAITSLPSGILGADLFIGTWSVPWVALVVAFPGGTWNLANSSFVAGVATINPNNYTFSTTQLLALYNFFPINGNHSGGFVRAFTVDYRLQLVALHSNGGGGTGGSNNSTTTQTIPSVITIDFGNVTQVGTQQVANMMWTNTYTQTFNGSFFLQGSQLATAQGVTLQVNGAPVPAADFTLTATSIQLAYGAEVVKPGAAIGFTVTYTVVPRATTSSTILYLNGVAIDASVILLILTLIFGGIYGYEKSRHEKRWSVIFNHLVSLTIFSMVVSMMLALA
jgi:hypothetical protein